MAAASPPSRPNNRLTTSGIVSFCLLLVLPVFAIARLASVIDWRLLMAYSLATSSAAWLAYRADKRRAQAGEWRIFEAALHLTELVGGWPGAFLAQRHFRHKISKTRYQVSFWTIVLTYQYAAFDYLIGWRIARRVGALF